MTREIRRQRQRVSIQRAAAAGDLARASALLAEHAIEFPQDIGLLDPWADDIDDQVAARRVHPER